MLIRRKTLSNQSIKELEMRLNDIFSGSYGKLYGKWFEHHVTIFSLVVHVKSVKRKLKNWIIICLIFCFTYERSPSMSWTPQRRQKPPGGERRLSCWCVKWTVSGVCTEIRLLSIYLRYDNNVKELSVCVCYNIVSELLESCFRVEYIKRTYFAKVATSDI